MTVSDTPVSVAKFATALVREYAARVEDVKTHDLHSSAIVCAEPAETSEDVVLEYEGAYAQVIALATFSDGTAMEVTEEDGLVLTSNQKGSVVVEEGVFAVVPPRAGSYLKSRLLAVSWQPNCTRTPLTQTSVVFAVKLPPAIAIEFGPKLARMAPPDDCAAAAGIPSKVGLFIRLKYPKDVVQNMEADDRAKIMVDSARFEVDRSGGKVLLKVKAKAPAGAGNVKVSFSHDNITSSLEFNVVVYKSLAVAASASPSFSGAEKHDATQLRPICGTNPLTWEKSALACSMKLSNGNVLPLKGPIFSLKHTTVSKTPVALKGGTLSASGASVAHAHCAFSKCSTASEGALPIKAYETCACVTEVASLGLVQYGRSLGANSAVRGGTGKGTASSRVGVTLADGRKYTASTPFDVASGLPKLFGFGTNSNASKIHAKTGTVTIQGNSDLKDTYTASVPKTGTCAQKQATVAMPSNLDPLACGDIDLGEEDGVANPSRSKGQSYWLKIRIKTCKQPLGRFDFTILYSKDDLGIDGAVAVASGNKKGAVKMFHAKGAECTVEVVVDTAGLRFLGICEKGAFSTVRWLRITEHMHSYRSTSASSGGVCVLVWVY